MKMLLYFLHSIPKMKNLKYTNRLSKCKKPNWGLYSECTNQSKKMQQEAKAISVILLCVYFPIIAAM